MQQNPHRQIALALSDQYDRFRSDAFPKRHFLPEHFHDVLNEILNHSSFSVRTVGKSFQERPIRLVTAGKGKTSVLLWSQMHGDESTATMALADILLYLRDYAHEAPAESILHHLSLSILPMLNPDGAAITSRRTAQSIDMNRDALALATPEARILRSLQENLKPEFGFNLHDQELSTVGNAPRLTSIGLLAPASDAEKSVSAVRSKAIRLAACLAESIGAIAPGLLARYDDAFEPRAFGDNMQKWGTSTVLIESGHRSGDPQKSEIRKLNAVGLLTALAAIANGTTGSSAVEAYNSLPFNGKKAYDLIVRNARISQEGGSILKADLGVSAQVDTHSEPPAKIVDIGDLSTFVGLEEIDAGRQLPLSQCRLGQTFQPF